MRVVNFTFTAGGAQLSYAPASAVALVGFASNVAAAVSEDPDLSYTNLTTPGKAKVSTDLILLIPAGSISPQLFFPVKENQRLYIVDVAGPTGGLVQLYFEELS